MSLSGRWCTIASHMLFSLKPGYVPYIYRGVGVLDRGLLSLSSPFGQYVTKCRWLYIRNFLRCDPLNQLENFTLTDISCVRVLLSQSSKILYIKSGRVSMPMLGIVLTSSISCRSAPWEGEAEQRWWWQKVDSEERGRKKRAA